MQIKIRCTENPQVNYSPINFLWVNTHPEKPHPIKFPPANDSGFPYLTQSSPFVV